MTIFLRAKWLSSQDTDLNELFLGHFQGNHKLSLHKTRYS